MARQAPELARVNEPPYGYRRSGGECVVPKASTRLCIRGPRRWSWRGSGRFAGGAAEAANCAIDFRHPYHGMVKIGGVRMILPAALAIRQDI